MAENKEDKKDPKVAEAIAKVPETPLVTEEKKEGVVENMAPTETFELTLKEELFCRNYAGTREFFGNGTRSYMDAYQTEDAHSASTLSARLLVKVGICQRISEILELGGWNDSFVDKQTLFLITQNGDLRAKASGIKLYNEVKNRIKRTLDIPEGTKFVVEMTTVQPDAGNNKDQVGEN